MKDLCGTDAINSSRRVGTIEADLRSAHDRDSQERAGEVENDDVLTQLDEMSLAELHQIREALRRMQNGTYGTCAGCGRPIGVERLSAVPTATTCVACTFRATPLTPDVQRDPPGPSLKSSEDECALRAALTTCGSGVQ